MLILGSRKGWFRRGWLSRGSSVFRLGDPGRLEHAGAGEERGSRFVDNLRITEPFKVLIVPGYTSSSFFAQLLFPLFDTTRTRGGNRLPPWLDSYDDIRGIENPCSLEIRLVLPSRPYAESAPEVSVLQSPGVVVRGEAKAHRQAVDLRTHRRQSRNLRLFQWLLLQPTLRFLNHPFQHFSIIYQHLDAFSTGCQTDRLRGWQGK